jgi:hypothetical protein
MSVPERPTLSTSFFSGTPTMWTNNRSENFAIDAKLLSLEQLLEAITILVDECKKQIETLKQY